MEIKYLGHSCFLIHFNDKRLLFDPFIGGNPLAQHIDIHSIKADYALISHGHGDHIGDAASIYKNQAFTAISNFEVISWLEGKAIPGLAMNHGGKRTLPFGTVKYVNAIHSSVLPDGTNGGNPGGFVIWDDHECFYFAGDTALHMDMKLIPLTCPPVNFAILPIGDVFTMGYDDALIAAEWLDCKTIIGCHYDSFDMIKIDHQKAVEAFSNKGIQLILPKIGETFSI